MRWGSLSHPDVVQRVELVDGRGALRVWDATRPQDHPWLGALRGNLDALGIVVALELRCRAAYRLRLDLRPGSLEQALDPATRAVPGRRYELYWFPGTDQAVQIVRDETTEPVARSARLRALWNEDILENVVLGVALAWANRAPERRVPGLRRLMLSTLGEDGDGYVDDWGPALMGDRRFQALSLEVAVPMDRTARPVPALHTSATWPGSMCR